MMVWIERDEKGRIRAEFACRQVGYAHEQMRADDPELMQFRAMIEKYGGFVDEVEIPMQDSKGPGRV